MIHLIHSPTHSYCSVLGFPSQHARVLPLWRLYPHLQRIEGAPRWHSSSWSLTKLTPFPLLSLHPLIHLLIFLH